MPRFKVGVVDTTFATVNMAKFVFNVLKKELPHYKIEYVTVPGIKDLPVAAKQLLDNGCDIAIALGMPGPEKIDKQCSHEASIGMQHAMLMTNKHILEVFVHINEAKNNSDLHALCKNRASKHALNAAWMLTNPKKMHERAGTGRRQGRKDAGPIKILKKPKRIGKKSYED